MRERRRADRARLVTGAASHQDASEAILGVLRLLRAGCLDRLLNEPLTVDQRLHLLESLWAFVVRAADYAERLAIEAAERKVAADLLRDGE